MKTKMIYDTDPYLVPYKKAIDTRHRRIREARDRMAPHGRLCDVLNNHLYYGLHREGREWVFLLRPAPRRPGVGFP